MIPNGGGAVSGIASFAGNQLQEHEYRRFQERMSFIVEVGTVIELTDIARDISFELAERYKVQLMCLEERPEEVVPVCCFCIPCSPCCLPDYENPIVRKSIVDNEKGIKNLVVDLNPLKDKRETKSPVKIQRKSFFGRQVVKQDQPIDQIVQFGATYMVQAILEEDIDRLNLSDNMNEPQLVKALVQLICQAKPDIQAKVLRSLNLDKNPILPYTPMKTSRPDEVHKEWYLYDFYQKPALRLIDDPMDKPSLPKLSWMNSDLYGHRLGTREEYEHLSKFDSKKS